MARKGLFMKRNRKNKIDRYLDAATFAFGHDLTPSEYWPLKPAQMTAYFEDSIAVGVFKKVEILRKKRVPLEKAAKMFSTPGILRNFLENFANTGLKVANNVGWFETSFKEREEFFNYLFKVLEEMVKNDIFLRDGMQIILDQGEMGKIPWNEFIKLDKETSKIIRRFNLAIFSLVWSFYFDVFTYTGFSLHGPYKVPAKKFGINMNLIINDYFNLRPVEIWPEAKNVLFEKVRICQIYKNINWKISFFERVDPSVNLNDNLIYSFIEIDGKIISDLEKVKELTGRIFEIIARQTDFVNNLSSLEKVKKASEICYYGLRGIFTYFNESWKPPKEIDDFIKKTGEVNIEKLEKDLSEYSKNEIIKVFDPRNNFVGY